MFKLAEWIAAALWGVIAIVLLFALAIAEGSLVGGVLAVVTAGAVYVYQATLCELDYLERQQNGTALRLLQALPLLLGIATLVVIALEF